MRLERRWVVVGHAAGPPVCRGMDTGVGTGRGLPRARHRSGALPLSPSYLVSAPPALRVSRLRLGDTCSVISCGGRVADIETPAICVGVRCLRF
jgi:hypothetical protein